MDGVQEELIHGEIIVSPNAKPLHTDIAEHIYRKLIPLENTGRWLVKAEVACRLTEESLPNTDACVVDRQLWQDARARNEYFSHVPWLAVEVKSPGNKPGALRKKAPLYLDHGAQQVWIVQPESSTVMIMTPEGDDRIAGPDGTLEFEDLAIPVAGIFSV
jgi:Uma2 family endonuclease